MAKKGLGRGLDALFGESRTDDLVISSPAKEDGEYVENLKLVDIEPNPNQPRSDFDEEALEELSLSIKEHGVITPIIVKRAENGFYQIVAGERRWRASKKAGLKTIPAIVKDFSEIETQQVALIENLQRRDLNPVEEALGYKRLMEEFSLTQEQISQKMGKSRSSVANSLRILALPPLAIDLLKSGKISFGHAKVLLSCDSKKKQEELSLLVSKQDLSVRSLEEIIKKKPKTQKRGKKGDLNLTLAFKEIEKKVSSSLGTNVKISPKGKKGTIQIEYYSSEELERLVKLLSK